MSCKLALSEQTYVRINESACKKAASVYMSYFSDFPDHNANFHFLEANRKTIGYFIVLDALNFGSGFKNIKRVAGSTYYSISNGIKDLFLSRNNEPSFSELSKLSDSDIMMIMQQELSDDAFVLAQLMRKQLTRLCNYGLESSLVKPSDLLSKNEYDVDDLIDILIKTDAFSDSYETCNNKIYILKRAQILCQDIILCKELSHLVKITGSEKLSSFADNLVPAVLLNDGILEYSDELRSKIEADPVIEEGSPEEIAIRVATVVAMENIKENAGFSVETRVLDFGAWNRGQALKSQTPLLRHMTKTDRY